MWGGVGWGGDGDGVEPMDMGYLGNVVPATVLLFHHLGYFQVGVWL